MGSVFGFTFIYLWSMKNLIIIGHPDKQSFCYNGIFKTIKTSIESKAGKVNFSDAMKNKAKLALQGATDSGDVDAVRFYGDSSAL